MANRSYCTVKDIKDTLGITSTTDDILIRKIAEAATKLIENHTTRTFHVEYGTKYFEGTNRLWLKPDLLSVSTLKLDEDGNASFEATLTTSDYVLLPFNEHPKNCIEISDNSNYSNFAKGSLRGVEIVGEWGFGDGESSAPYIADTVISEALTSGEDAIDVSATGNIAAGQTWLIDSEQFYVRDISASTASVITGVNGTSKASHTASTTIYIYQYPADIRQACIDLTVSEYQNRDKKGINSESIGDYRYTLDKSHITSILNDSLINNYRRLKF